MDQLVIMSNQQAVTSSTILAESFGREHHDVIKSIERMKEDVGTFPEMFYQSSEPDSYGRDRKIYLMNRDGFTLLAMGFTGSRAMEFKIKYIDAFNKMEEHLNKPMSIEDMIITQAKSVKEIKQDVDQLKTVVDNEVWLTERQKKDVQDTVSRRVFELKRKGQEAHFQTLYSSLKRFFGVSKYDKIPRKDYQEAIDFIKGWYPPVRKEYKESR